MTTTPIGPWTYQWQDVPRPFVHPVRTPAGRVVSKRTLSAKLSDLEDCLGDNALEAFVSRLRRKLAGSGVRIRTLRGLGYLLEAEA